MSASQIKSGLAAFRLSPKRVGFDPQLLQHRHEHVAQRRCIGRIEYQMLAVLETTAGQQHRQAPVRVVRGVSQVTGQQDRGSIEQRRVVFQARRAEADQLLRRARLLAGEPDQQVRSRPPSIRDQ